MPNLIDMPTSLTRKDFVQISATPKLLSLVHFRAEWSGSSQLLNMICKDLERSYKGMVNFFDVDADAETELVKQFGIMEIPTLLMFFDGNVVDHVLGLTSKNKLIAKIENALSANN
jgi:thioredoxin 1